MAAVEVSAAADGGQLSESSFSFKVKCQSQVSILSLDQSCRIDNPFTFDGSHSFMGDYPYLYEVIHSYSSY